MKFTKAFGIILLFATAIFLFACDGGGSGGGGSVDSSSDSSGTGTVSFGLTDTSTDKYQAVYVTIDEVQVNRNDSPSDDNGSWKVVATPRKTYNLLRLVNGVTETLGQNELAVGIYKQIRLIIGEIPESENNIFGVAHPFANYVILADGSDKPLKIPSGINTGIKLVHHFNVNEDQVVELLLDFDACRSVVRAGKSGKYILKPTIKVIEPQDKSEVLGTVTERVITDSTETFAPISGALVSAQISEQSSASIARSTLTNENGEYSMLLSPDQSYNIVVYKGDENSDIFYRPDCQNVDAPLDAIIQKDFILTNVLTEFGTVTGQIIVTLNDGQVNEEDPPVVYVSFYTAELDCGYVEVTTLPASPDTDGTLTYTVELPFGTYDVVASAENFIPDTGAAVVDGSEDSGTVPDLFITERPGV